MPVVKQSRYSFAETTSRLLDAIVHAGNIVFARSTKPQQQRRRGSRCGQRC